ncbi:MAG TPA: hypothetical protein VKT82_07045 [Ktedonobacterales bacterium]|nr:hypothetical protein [Ktedonobacterales bacterium]
MVRFLRKSWLAIAIIICALALVPVTLGIVNNDKTYQLMGIGIFLVGMLFALICVLVVGAASFNKKGASKADQKQ